MIYYITFGADSFRKYCYQRIFSNSEIEARERARYEYGDSWAGFYTEDEGKRIVEKYGLEEIEPSIALIKRERANAQEIK